MADMLGWGKKLGERVRAACKKAQGRRRTGGMQERMQELALLASPKSPRAVEVAHESHQGGAARE